MYTYWEKIKSPKFEPPPLWVVLVTFFHSFWRKKTVRSCQASVKWWDTFFCPFFLALLVLHERDSEFPFLGSRFVDVCSVQFVESSSSWCAWLLTMIMIVHLSLSIPSPSFWAPPNAQFHALPKLICSFNSIRWLCNLKRWMYYQSRTKNPVRITVLEFDVGEKPMAVYLIIIILMWIFFITVGQFFPCAILR